jgi:hypothetical protein
MPIGYTPGSSSRNTSGPWNGRDFVHDTDESWNPPLVVQTATVPTATFDTASNARSVRLEVITGTATWAGITFVPGEFREYTEPDGGIVAPITVTISSGSVRYEYAT